MSETTGLPGAALRARLAARAAVYPPLAHESRDARRNGHARVDAALAAAHDPALGLDRSVCLRDVVEALNRAHDGALRLPVTFAAASRFIAREFGGET